MKDVNFPLGFVFSLDDSDLVELYLFRKTKGKKLLSNCIVDLDNIYQYNPDHLLYHKSKFEGKSEAFFFTSNESYLREEGQIRVTPGGYWEVYKGNVEIHSAGRSVGYKTKLSFHVNNENADLTHWKMIQFRCSPFQIWPFNEKIIICKIKLRKKDEVKDFVEVISEDEDNL